MEKKKIIKQFAQSFDCNDFTFESTFEFSANYYFYKGFIKLNWNLLGNMIICATVVGIHQMQRLWNTTYHGPTEF